MNIKITRPDGTIIEAEGTAEECQAFALAMAPAPAPQFVSIKSAPLQPVQQPMLPWGTQPWDVIMPYTPQPYTSPWIPEIIGPDLTWWTEPPNTTGGLWLNPGSTIIVGDRLPVSTGTVVMGNGWQCTPTGANVCS